MSCTRYDTTFLYLRANDELTFIPTFYIPLVMQALDDLDFSPQIRKKYARLLYEMCAGRSLLPKSLQTEVGYNQLDRPHHRGGFADVWKGTYGDREVAVKVLRIDLGSDLQKITRVSR